MYNTETTDKYNCHNSENKQDFACIIYLVSFQVAVFKLAS